MGNSLSNLSWDQKNYYLHEFEKRQYDQNLLVRNYLNDEQLDKYKELELRLWNNYFDTVFSRQK